MPNSIFFRIFDCEKIRFLNMKNDLYELIQSLSKSEKRYFKLVATQHKKQQTDYLVLYEILEKQATYDEVQLQKKLQKMK